MVRLKEDLTLRAAYLATVKIFKRVTSPKEEIRKSRNY